MRNIKKPPAVTSLHNIAENFKQQSIMLDQTDVTSWRRFGERLCLSSSCILRQNYKDNMTKVMLGSCFIFDPPDLFDKNSDFTRQDVGAAGPLQPPSVSLSVNLLF